MPDETPQAPPSGGDTGAPNPAGGAPPPVAHGAPPPVGDPPADPFAIDLSDLDAAAEVQRKADPKWKGWSVKPEELQDPAARRVAHNLQSDYSRKMAGVAQEKRELAQQRQTLQAQTEELEQRRAQIGKNLLVPDGKPPTGEPPDGMVDPDGRAAWFAKKAAAEFHQEQQEQARKQMEGFEKSLAEQREKAQVEAWTEQNPEVQEPGNIARIVAVINDTTLPLCTPQEAWALVQDEEALTPAGKAAIAKWTAKFQGMSPLDAWKYERSVIRQRPAPEVEQHNRALDLGRPRHARPALRPMPMTNDLAEVRKWQEEGGTAADEAIDELRRTGISA